MSAEPDRRLGELERLVVELRRVNERLARELVGSVDSRRPRSPVTAARAVNGLREQGQRARAELEEAQRQLREAEAHLDHLRRENEALRHEAARLRFGLLGLLRRGLARLLRRPAAAGRPGS